MINIEKHKHVIIINGSGGVGKDTVVKYVTEMVYTIKQDWLVYNYSSVDKVKEIAKEIGWDGTKTERNRKFLSDLKILTTEYNDMPFNAMKEKYSEFANDENAALLFLHIREPIEIEKAKKEFNAITLLVKRDSLPQITSNIADGSVFDYTYDIVIDNNCTERNLKSSCYDLAYDLVLNDKFESYYNCKEQKV